MTLDANEGVAVDTTAGAPVLRLSNGAIAVYDAAASAATSADKLVFTYVVGTGADTPNLRVSALELNGSVISGHLGGFTVQPAFPASADNIAVADVDGDGNPDIVTSSRYGGTITVLKGDGAGNFAAPQSFAAGEKSMGIALGDVNGDGKIDVVVGGERLSGSISVLLGEGAGRFAAPQSITAIAGTYTNDVALADVTGDGKLDIITTGSNHSVGAVLVGDGAGHFAAPQPFQGGRAAEGLAVADVTGDGRPDIIVADVFGGILVLTGQGAGSFAAPQAVGSLSGVTSLAVADITGDGKLDIVTGSEYWGSGVKALGGDGTGQFSAPYVVGGLGGFANLDGSRAFDVAVADVTADGLPDILAAGAGKITVLAAQADGPGPTLDISTVATVPKVNGGMMVDTTTVVVDTTAPRLAGFSVVVRGRDPADPLLPGDLARVTVTLTEAVTLSPGGQAVLNLSNGAVLSGGTMSQDGHSLMYWYRVTAADGSSELNLNGLTLSAGATLRDQAGNDVLLTDMAADHQTSGAPTINGTAIRGEVLAASIGTLTDPDGLAAVTCHWERDD
ncbi:FG-GAP repeat domain-containing protein, partial [Muricoccus vinaceus]